MSEINKDGKIMWRYCSSFYADQEGAEQAKRIAHGLLDIERVRVTPEPEPERFYVKIVSCLPIEIRDRKYAGNTCARFWNSLGDHDSMVKRAEAHAAWLNEEAKKHD